MRSNNISSVACEKARNKGYKMLYDTTILREVNDLSKQELIEIGVINTTKHNLVEFLNDISESISKIEDGVYKGVSVEEFINEVFDKVNRLSALIRR